MKHYIIILPDTPHIFCYSNLGLYIYWIEAFQWWHLKQFRLLAATDAIAEIVQLQTNSRWFKDGCIA